MITLKEWMEVISYRVTDGSDYTWPCFGEQSRPYTLSAWNGDYDGWSFNIVFDTNHHDVYLAEACDYKRNRAYRLINPEYATAYKEYAKKHNSGYEDQAWDNVDFVDLDVDDDWIQKALAIVEGNDYDTRVQVPVEFTDQELLTYMKMAHERDMTFNQFVEEALKDLIEQHKDKL